MLVMFMMNEALAHIHSEFLTRNLVNLFKVIFWAIFCPFSTNMGAQLQRKSTSGYPGCTQRLNSPPLQCWLCRLCKLIVFCKSLFQLSVTSKVLKNKGATKRAYHSLYSTFEPPSPLQCWLCRLCKLIAFCCDDQHSC